MCMYVMYIDFPSVSMILLSILFKSMLNIPSAVILDEHKLLILPEHLSSLPVFVLCRS